MAGQVENNAEKANKTYSLRKTPYKYDKEAYMKSLSPTQLRGEKARAALREQVKKEKSNQILCTSEVLMCVSTMHLVYQDNTELSNIRVL